MFKYHLLIIINVDIIELSFHTILINLDLGITLNLINTMKFVMFNLYQFTEFLIKLIMKKLYFFKK